MTLYDNKEWNVNSLQCEQSTMYNVIVYQFLFVCVSMSHVDNFEFFYISCWVGHSLFSCWVGGLF